MSGANGGEMRGGNNDASGTVNAAATAIAAAENLVPQAFAQKKRWGSCWSHYWCFGSRKNKKRIGHVDIPDTSATRVYVPALENPAHPPPIVFPFVAPPSSPASFGPSQPPSLAQSPAGWPSMSSMTATLYSPSWRASMFSVDPFADEKQLVTPPTFSSYTSESSTAPLTPHPESTTPSSPEVPFALLLDPIQHHHEGGQRFPMSQHEFQPYLQQPGSPVSNLISPCSGISGSGTSTPSRDREFVPGKTQCLEFRTSDHTKLFNLETVSREWGSQQGSGTLTPDNVAPKISDGVLSDNQSNDILYHSTTYNGSRTGEMVFDHRVSFEITAEKVVRCVEKKSDAMHKVASVSQENVEQTGKGENGTEVGNGHGHSASENSYDAFEKAYSDEEDGRCHKKQRSTTLSFAKEFDFDNVDGRHSEKSCISSDWWVNKPVLGKGAGTSKNWSIFTMVQPGVV